MNPLDRLRASFVTGLLLVAPLAVTLFVLDVAEYPRRGVYALGFVTNHAPRRVSKQTDEDLSVVFFPHSPNPTAGKLAMLPDEELVELDMSVSRSLRLIVTIGPSIEDPEELPETMAQ